MKREETRREKSSLPPVLASVGAALLVCGAFRFLGDAPQEGARDGELVAALARIERRLHDVEHQVKLATGARVEPAEVTRVAEERGIGVDDAWNEYFDGIVTRLDRLERRLDGGEMPPMPDDARLAQFAQWRSLMGLQDVQVAYGVQPSGEAATTAAWHYLLANGQEAGDVRGALITLAGSRRQLALRTWIADQSNVQRIFTDLGDGRYQEASGIDAVHDPADPNAPSDAPQEPDSGDQ